MPILSRDRRRRFLLGSGTLSLVLALWPVGCRGPQGRTEIDLPIYFTCDTRGRLEPCGCFTGQYGGLTRLKTVLDAEAGNSAVRVDVGDVIAGREDYHLIEYRYLLRALAEMKYDVLNLGHREAQLSLVQLEEIKRTTPVPMISANLLNKATGQPVFDAYRVIERGGFRIALLGVVDPRGLSAELGEGLIIEGMETTLTRRVAELRSKADLIVLLAFTDEASLARLAQQFYELHVILGGKVSQPAQELKQENRSWIYFVTNESRALGILKVRLADGVTPKPTGNEIRLLHDRIPQDNALRALAQAYRQEVRRTRLAVDDPAKIGADTIPGARHAATYVGSQRCADCHQSATHSWKASAHAQAFATLVDRQADADPKCLGCHTTGFGNVSGYRREFGADKLVNVGCESCHGPGSLHAAHRQGDATINFTYRPLGAGDCQKCHFGEFSRPFHWDEFWPAIKHGKESAPAAAARLPNP